jgi:hypothetical protein
MMDNEPYIVNLSKEVEVESKARNQLCEYRYNKSDKNCHLPYSFAMGGCHPTPATNSKIRVCLGWGSQPEAVMIE